MTTGMIGVSPKFRALVAYLVLALMAAVAGLGLLGVFWSAAPRAAEAGIRDVTMVASANAGVNTLTGPLRSPSAATAAITGGSASINPVDPGAATRLQVGFTVGAAGQLDPGTGEIVITLDDDFQVPASLDRDQITISTTEVSHSSDGCDPAVASCPVSGTMQPQSVTLDFVGPENDEPEITLVVPDMLPGSTHPAIGAQGIAGGSTVTVAFQQSAGIRNSTEAGNRSVIVRTSADPFSVSLGPVTVPVRVQMSSDGDPRGESLSVVAVGVEGGTTVTFWLDLNGDGFRPNEPGAGAQPGEQDLCSAVAASSDVATCSLTVSNPPFVPGFGTDCVLPALFNCNFINAKDGDVVPRTTGFPLALTQEFVNRQNFELEPTLEISPTIANVGDRVIVSLFDFPPGDAITAAGITIGGVAATSISPATAIVLASGQANFTLTIPSGVRRGTQRIVVQSNSGVEQDTNVTIGGAQLQLSTNDTAVANQDLTIIGSGFTRGSGNCIPERLITLDGVPLRLDRGSLDAACDDVPEAGDRGVELSSGATFTATVRIIASDGTIPFTLLRAGVKELKVIDSQGTEGVIHVETPSRTMSVEPGASGPGSTITVRGSAFPVSNPNEPPFSMSLDYDAGGSCVAATSSVTDATGAFRGELTVPACAPVSSTNRVFATLSNTNNVVVATHHVTGSLVAEVDLAMIPHRDPVDGATGLKVDITQITEPATGSATGVLIGSFEARLTYDGTCVSVLDVRGMDFQITDPDIDNVAGVSTFGGTDVNGVSWPADLSHVLTRLSGSIDQDCQVDLEVISLDDVNGNPIPAPMVLSQIVRRGDARADGAITIGDASYIAQYLARLRHACAAEVHLDCLHSVNAASVRQDGDFDQKTIADALFIAQQLVGQRDEFYDLIP